MSIFGGAIPDQENKPEDVAVPPRSGKIVMSRQHFNWYLQRKGIPYFLEYRSPVHYGFSVDILNFFEEVEKYYEEQDMIQELAKSLRQGTKGGCK